MKNLSLKKLKFHEDMSEETPCFSADLYENNKLVAHVNNSGHGGCNTIHPAKGLKYKDIEHLTDLNTDCHIMGLAEDLNITKKHQTKALVLKKGDNISTVGFSKSISQIKKIGKIQQLIDSVKRWEAKGFEVLNTNI